MAAVLESIAVPRASMFRTSSSIMASGISDVHIARGNRSLHEFKGLKMKTSLPIRTLVSKRKSVRAVRGGKVVCEAQDTAVEVPDVTEDTWQSLVVESDLPVLVDFWAPWCGPCRMILPIISELSKQYAGKLKCYKMNTDEAPTTATRLGIRSIPTVIIFKKGEKKDAIIGAVPKSTLTASIDKFLERISNLSN